MPEITVEKQLFQTQFLERENNIQHLTYDKEFLFYNAVAQGNLEEVQKIMLPLHNEQLGKLSDNPLRNIKYHLIITISLITRFCIEGGMLPEEAYSLSDIYIRKLDKLGDEESVSELHKKIVFDYTKKMQKIKRQKIYSKQTYQVIDYIYDNLHEKISLDDLADHTNMNKTYMCELFRKETGLTIGDYILKRKIEAAQNMLQYSEYSFSEISNILGFSSHSHFIASFKKITGTTPKHYRDENFRNQLAKN